MNDKSPFSCKTIAALLVIGFLIYLGISQGGFRKLGSGELLLSLDHWVETTFDSSENTPSPPKNSTRLKGSSI